MPSEQTVDEALVTAVSNTDDAVGVESSHWYIAIVNNHSERGCSERLSLLGYDNYVPIQHVTVTGKNGRKHEVTRVVLPALVFVRTNERIRRTQVAVLPFINRFMTDPARRNNPRLNSPVAIIPDDQMQAFRCMVENADVPVQMEGVLYHQGDRVRVSRGKLAGLEGFVSKTNEGKTRLCVSLDILGCASVEMDQSCLEKVIS